MPLASSLALPFMGLVVLASLAAHPAARAEVTEFQIKPSAADPRIKTFDTPHFGYVNRDIVVDHRPGLPADRRQLLVWLTGTGGKAAGARAFCRLAAEQGYCVVSLMYPDDVPATVCRNDPDPIAFEEFRLAVIKGGKTRHLAVDRPESIENRLASFLARAAALRPREGWGRFLAEGGGAQWKDVAVAGQSQGGGHAALIAIKHEVARVICTGAPKDYSQRLRRPAAWYREKSATPKRRFFAFNHVQDPKGCTPTQQLEILRVLGLDAFGPPVDAATAKSPFDHTHILTTSFPAVVVDGPESEGAAAAHTAVIANRHAARWEKVWIYLLTEPVE